MMRAVSVALFVMLLGGRAILGQGAADGEVSGRLTDVTGAPIPGAFVEVTGGDERREMVTDAEGRFEFLSLGLTTYHVAIELPGFRTRDGEIHLSPSNRRAHLEWTIEVGCLDIADRVPQGIRSVAWMADAIVHVRVEADAGLLVWSTRPECDGEVLREYDALVLNAVPGRGSDVTRLHVLGKPSPERLVPGAEYLALLWSRSGATHFSADNLLPIVADHVVSPGTDGLHGMSVEQALETLRAWSMAGQQ